MGKKVGILGSGQVAQALGSGFLKHGYDVMLSSRQPEKLNVWKSNNPGGLTGYFTDAAEFGDIVVLAVQGAVAEDALELARPSNLHGKTVIDATNPISSDAPVNGVLQFFTDSNDSLMAHFQRKLPDVHFVKAFSCVGNALMVNPELPGGKPSMFICGNDSDAKQEVTTILDQFGWETEDMGTVDAAGAIEALCVLWCIPGLRDSQWNHAFKLLKG